MQARSAATLERIHTATEALIGRDGIGSVTIDAVAAEAGISKGGVLYHFRSKEALVTAVAMRRLRLTEQAIDQAVAAIADGPNRKLRGVIAVGESQYGCKDSFSRALLIASTENSQSLEAFKSAFSRVLNGVRDDSIDPDLGAAHFFSVMGLLFAQTLGLGEPPEAAAAILAALKRHVTALGGGAG